MVIRFWGHKIAKAVLTFALKLTKFWELKKAQTL